MEIYPPYLRGERFEDDQNQAVSSVKYNLARYAWLALEVNVLRKQLLTWYAGLALRGDDQNMVFTNSFSHRVGFPIFELRELHNE